MQGVERALGVFEPLDLVGLLHHRSEQTAHKLHHSPFQARCLIRIFLPVGESQAPHGENAVDVVAHPGMRVVAMHGDCSAGRKQPRHRILAGEDDGLCLAIVIIQA